MSIEKIGKGAYRVRAWTRPDPKTGRRHQRKRVVKGSMRDAKALEEAIASEVPEALEDAPFSEWAASWLAGRDLSDATRDYYRRGLADINAEIGDVLLSRLKPYDCERALLAIPRGSVRKRARKALSAALRHAEKVGAVRESPMRRVDVPDGCPPPSRDRLTPEEARSMLAAVRGTSVEAAALLSCLCGLRREEVCGLEWRDIDLERGLVSVRRAYTSSRVLKEPKTAGSRRDVPLSGYALGRMRELSRDEAGNPRIGPVVASRRSRDGRMLPGAVSRTYSRICDRAGLRHVPFENLRHTFATAAIEAGVPGTTLQGLLGHSRFSTTAGYVASLHTDARAAVDGIVNYIVPEPAAHSHDAATQI